MVRSPYAHARITGIDASEALALPGVEAVLTGADFVDAWTGPMPCAWPVTEDMKNPEHFPVAVDRACYVGDIVAVVVADSRYAAADAVGAVIVDYDPLEAVVDLEDALSDRVVIHDALGTNRSYDWELIPDQDAVDAAFADAAHTVKERYVQQRLIPAAMEPRGVVVVPQPHGGEYTMWSATQIPHILKVMLAATAGVPEHKLRVIAPSVGGGFGSKLDVYAEELITLAVARQRRVPARWTEGRSENAHATIQGRGQIQDMELAADADGKVTAVRVHLLADMGAYLQLITPGIPLLGAFLYHGLYDVPAYSFTCTGVFTNKTPTDAYRGAGRPEATYAIERAMDALARKVGIGPDEIRRRNFIPTDAFPYSSVGGLVFDSGNYAPNLEKALDLVRWDERKADQAARRAAGDTVEVGPRHLHLRRDVRPGAEPGAGLAQLRRRRLGGGPGARAPHRHRAGGHRRHAARPGPRDHVVDADRRQARRQHGRRRGAPQRHRRVADRHGHLRVPVAGRRRHRHRDGGRPGDRQGPRHRRPPARGGRGRPRVQPTAPSGWRAAPTRSCPSRRSPSRPSPPTTCPTAWSRTSTPA